MMEPFGRLTSKTFVIERNNVDTDQIIPGRFLTLDARAKLGEKLFYDWRYDELGNALPDEPLNSLDACQTRILVAGDNFGCGSSREHAVWALLDFGFRAAISTNFADIFRNNALNNGLLTIDVSPHIYEILKQTPGAEVTIDLGACVFKSLETGEVSFDMDSFARKRFLKGLDAMDYLLQHTAEIAEFETRNGFAKTSE